MFLRRCQRKKCGKTHTYWALVESYRTARGSRQRVIAYLGDLKRGELDGWAKLGMTASGKRKTRPEPSLFDPPRRDEPLDDELALVKLRGVRLERTRSFGDVWLAWGLWRLLGLDTLFEGLIPEGREEISWHQVAAILTIARFCEPSSELHIEEKWYRETALDELLGVEVEKVHTDRLYVGLDKLLPHKDAVEKHIRKQLGELFDLNYELLLYDITSTYFEGECRINPLAKRGYSRDSRPDCLQVLIGLVVTDDGYPVGYEVFEGNRHDSKTVQEVVGSMEKKYGRTNRVWVMDRGMVSDENLSFLRERNGSYIVGAPKAMLRRFEKALSEEVGWSEPQEGVRVKLVPATETGEVFLLAKSDDRRAKEQAMHERFVTRLEAGLRKIETTIASGHLVDEGVANRRLGRLFEKNWRATGAFDVRIERLAKPEGKARLKISWSRDAEWSKWASISEGCYVLRSNLSDVDAVSMWKRYIQLTEAEWAFRIAKDELSIRPIWHHKECRVRAHIFVCFLAYVMWKTLAGWMERSGLGHAPRKLVDEFHKIKSGDIVLPTITRDGKESRTIRLRCVTEPDAAQKVLLSRMGLSLPRRLRRLDDPLKEESRGD